MKYFDPNVGWDKQIVPLIGGRAKMSQNSNDDTTASPTPESTNGEQSAGSNKVFHFSRVGNPLHIIDLDKPDGEAVLVQNNAAIAAESSRESSVQSPSALLTFSVVIEEMFSALPIHDENSNELPQVLDSMRHLSEKLHEKQQIEKNLAGVVEEINFLRRILDERVLAAQAREKQSLAASKVRVELMQELVTTLVAPGEVHRKK